MMKKEYTTPDLELTVLQLSCDILALSDPEPTVPGGGSGNSDPNDPFGGL